MPKEFVTKQQDALRFTRDQLAQAFNRNKDTIAKMVGKTPPSGKRGRAHVWYIGDVAELKDTRTPYVPPHMQKPDRDDIEHDPDKMTPAERRLHYQAEDLKQASLLKERKNATESRELIPAQEVEQVLANAFKAIALTMDTLPDALERDGLIGSSDIGYVIDILDRARDQLAVDLSTLSPPTMDINDNGDW